MYSPKWGIEHPRLGDADRELLAHRQRATRVPVSFDRDLQLLEVDAHVRGDHAQGGLLAGRQGGKRQVPGTRRVAVAADGRVRPAAKHGVGRRLWSDDAVQGVGEIAAAASHAQNYQSAVGIVHKALPDRRLTRSDVYLRRGHVAAPFVRSMVRSRGTAAEDHGQGPLSHGSRSLHRRTAPVDREGPRLRGPTARYVVITTLPVFCPVSTYR